MRKKLFFSSTCDNLIIDSKKSQKFDLPSTFSIANISLIILRVTSYQKWYISNIF